MASSCYNKDHVFVVILKKVSSLEEAEALAELIKTNFLVASGLFCYKMSMFEEKIKGVHIIAEIPSEISFTKLVESVGKSKVSRVHSLAEFIPSCASFIALKRKERMEQAPEKEKEKEPETPVKKTKTK